MTLVENGPTCVADVRDAARVVLGMWQRHTYVAWRDARWYDDEALSRLIDRERRDARYEPDLWLMRVHEGDVFSAPTAMEVLIAGLRMVPTATISSLEQLGLHHADSPDEDFDAAFGLLDRPMLFDAIREMKIPLGEVQAVIRAFGVDRLVLAWRAGWSTGEVSAAVHSGDLPEMDMLGVLAALRR